MRAWLTTRQCAELLGQLYAEMLRLDGYTGDLEGVRGVYDSRYIRQAIEAGELQTVHLPLDGGRTRRTYRILRPDFDDYLATRHPRLSVLQLRAS